MYLDCFIEGKKSRVSTVLSIWWLCYRILFFIGGEHKGGHDGWNRGEKQPDQDSPANPPGSLK